MVKRGSKAHPLCTFCKKDGHYSSTCPLLAQKCLKALSGHNLKSLEKHVAEGKKLYVSGLPGKSQRTLKSASGKRSWNEVSKVGGTKKVRKAESKKEHAKKDGIRRPRPKSIRDQQPVFNAKCTRSAYRKLVSAGWKDVLSFSYLPVVRMPLYHVWLAAEAWFATTKPPSLSDLGQRLGYNSQRCGVLRRLVRAFLVAESRCAQLTQASRTLSGPLEVDGTSIKKWRPAGSTTNYYQQVFGVVERNSNRINLHEFGTVAAQNFGKPPTESLLKLETCGAASFIAKKSVVISDGCPAYATRPIGLENLNLKPVFQGCSALKYD
ncbi:Uncharacterized protein SCF082_LOCUS28378, partial [Durusdinium trenchii]